MGLDITFAICIFCFVKLVVLKYYLFWLLLLLNKLLLL
jgi:hypothetical protein